MTQQHEKEPPAVLVVAGTHSGVGKTSVACGLMQAYTERGLKVQPFKCGPDFLDGQHHARCCGNFQHASSSETRSINLDGWLQGGQQAVLESFRRHAAYSQADICIVEGVMGLFDGKDGDHEDGSTAQIAKWLNAPVLLVVDAHSMTRSVAAMVLGYQQLDKDLRVAALVCNFVNSAKHKQWIREALEAFADRLLDPVTRRPVLFAGVLPRNDRVVIPERLLGLDLSCEKGSESRYKRLGEVVESNLDLDALFDVAKTAAATIDGHQTLVETHPATNSPCVCRIGVARDEAFSFYYDDNLWLLEQAGATIVYFSPLHDAHLPDALDALYIGGGYPELHAPKLESNVSLRHEINSFARAGGSIYAECGGFMYICQALWTAVSADSDTKTGQAQAQPQQRFEMCGILQQTTAMTPNVKLGYYEATATKENPLFEEGLTCRGQEFHFSHVLEESRNDVAAFMISSANASTGTSPNEPLPVGFSLQNVVASYMHLHWASCPVMASSFCQSARRNSPFKCAKAVSFVSAATEIVFALGQERMLAGVTSICDHPARAPLYPRRIVCRSPFDAPQMTSEEVTAAVQQQQRTINESSSAGSPGYWLMDTNAIANIHPEIAFVQDTCDICDASRDDALFALKECGLLHGDNKCKIIPVNPKTLGGVFEAIDAVAEALKIPGKGRGLCEKLQRSLDSLSKRLDTSIRPRVLSLEGLAPLCVGGGWLPDMKWASGCQDAFNDVGGAPARNVSWKQVVEADPDVLILSPCSASPLRTLKELHLVNVPEFWSLRCVREGLVYIMDHAKYSRPGPRLVDGVIQLACSIRGISPPEDMDTSEWEKEVLKYDCCVGGVQHCTTELSQRFKPLFGSSSTASTLVKTASVSISTENAVTVPSRLFEPSNVHVRQVSVTRCSLLHKQLPEDRSAFNLLGMKDGSALLFAGNLDDGSQVADVWKLHPPANGWSSDLCTYGSTPRLGSLPTWEYLQCTKIADEAVPTVRSNSAAVVCKDYLLVFGGWDSKSQCIGNLELLHLKTLCWTHCSVRNIGPCPRGNPSLVYSPKHNSAILFGGWDRHKRFDDLWILDMNRWEWRQVQKQDALQWPSGRTDHTAILWEKSSSSNGLNDGMHESMVVFGGSTSTHGCTNELWEFDLELLQWHRIDFDVGPAPRTSHAVSFLFSKDKATMVIVGGSGDGCGQSRLTDDAWMLDLETFCWTSIDEMKGSAAAGRCRHGIVSFGGTLVIWGGFDGNRCVQDGASLWTCCSINGGTKSNSLSAVGPQTAGKEDHCQQTALSTASQSEQNLLQEQWEAEVPVRVSDLPLDVLTRAQRSKLPGALFQALHRHAMSLNRTTYIDPDTGYSVFTQGYLQQRPCCGNGCRHCPHGHVNVPDTGTCGSDDSSELDW